MHIKPWLWNAFMTVLVALSLISSKLVDVYLLHNAPGDQCVGGIQDLPHQHWFEEGPGYGSPCGINHVQVQVGAEGSWRRREWRRITWHTVYTKVSPGIFPACKNSKAVLLSTYWHCVGSWTSRSTPPSGRCWRSRGLTRTWWATWRRQTEPGCRCCTKPERGWQTRLAWRCWTSVLAPSEEKYRRCLSFMYKDLFPVVILQYFDQPCVHTALKCSSVVVHSCNLHHFVNASGKE